jgi:hypothetical protein
MKHEGSQNVCRASMLKILAKHDFSEERPSLLDHGDMEVVHPYFYGIFPIPRYTTWVERYTGHVCSRSFFAALYGWRHALADLIFVAGCFSSNF